MTIVEYDDYRDMIKDKFTLLKSERRQTTWQQVADAARVQRPYISKVMHHDAHLNSDQLFEICQFFQMPERDVDFSLLLLEFNRSVSEKRRALLKKRIGKIRASKKQMKNVLEVAEEVESSKNLEEYYMEPMNQIVHMALTIERFRKNQTKLAEVLKISEQYLAKIISYLKKTKLIEIDGRGKVRVVKPAMHLPKESPLCQAHQSQLNMYCKSTRSIRGVNPLTFSVLFSTKRDLKDEFERALQNLINKMEKKSSTKTPDSVFYLNIELESLIDRS